MKRLESLGAVTHTQVTSKNVDVNLLYLKNENKGRESIKSTCSAFWRIKTKLEGRKKK